MKKVVKIDLYKMQRDDQVHRPIDVQDLLLTVQGRCNLYLAPNCRWMPVSKTKQSPVRSQLTTDDLVRWFHSYGVRLG